MKHINLPIHSIFLALCLLSRGVSAAAACDDAPQLRYQWKPGEKYAYSVKVEIEEEQTLLVYSGYCTYIVAAEDAKTRPGEAQRDSKVAKLTATAFAVSPDGILLTCAHAVRDAETIEVAIGGKTQRATVLDLSLERDLALLKIDATGLPTLALGNSDAVQVGQDCSAIGFPLSSILGDNVKISRGIIAGISLRDGQKIFQVDATINPGNSGGPIVSDSREVLAVAAAKVPDEVAAKVGFALPIDYAKPLLDKHKVPLTPNPASKKLDGPALVNRVSPAVALVTTTPKAGVNAAFTLTCIGSLSPSRVPKPDAKLTAQERAELLKDSTRLQIAGLQLALFRPSTNNELQVDSRGRVLRETDSGSLFGSLKGLVIEPLPDHAVSTWKTESPLSVSLRNANRSVSTYPAHQRAVYTISNVSGDTVEIRRQVELKTEESVADEPRYQLIGDGSITFDWKAGIPREMTLKAKITDNNGTTSRRTPITFSYKLLEGEEREKGLAKTPEPAKQPRTIGDLNIDDQIADLKSSDSLRQRLAADRLQLMKPDAEHRDEVAEVMERMLSSDDQFTRLSGVRGLATWGREASIDALLEALNHEDRLIRSEALKTLGKLKAERALKTIAKFLTSNFERASAREAILAIGAAAEPTVREYLSHEDWTVRREATNLLRQIGLKDSIPALEKVAEQDENALVKASARMAINIINKGAASNRNSSDQNASSVKVIITELSGRQSGRLYEIKLKALAGTNLTFTKSTWDESSKTLTVELAPVPDVDAFVKKLDFGEVTTVEDRVIKISLKK